MHRKSEFFQLARFNSTVFMASHYLHQGNQLLVDTTWLIFEPASLLHHEGCKLLSDRITVRV